MSASHVYLHVACMADSIVSRFRFCVNYGYKHKIIILNAIFQSFTDIKLRINEVPHNSYL